MKRYGTLTAFAVVALLFAAHLAAQQKTAPAQQTGPACSLQQQTGPACSLKQGSAADGACATCPGHADGKACPGTGAGRATCAAEKGAQKAGCPGTGICADCAKDTEGKFCPKMKASILTLSGVLVDAKSARANAKRLPAFVEKATKKSVAKAAGKDGYQLYVNGRLHSFDETGNAAVAKFLAAKESALRVTVKARKVGEKLSLIEIANAQ